MVAAFLAKPRKKAMPDWVICRCRVVAHRRSADLDAASRRAMRAHSGFKSFPVSLPTNDRPSISGSPGQDDHRVEDEPIPPSLDPGHGGLLRGASHPGRKAEAARAGTNCHRLAPKAASAAPEPVSGTPP